MPENNSARATPAQSAAFAADREARFAKLFPSSDFHGTFQPSSAWFDPEKQKVEVQYRSLNERITTDHWREHLTGQQPLCISPVRDGLASWIGIDDDSYDSDISVIAREIERQKLPALLVRSKSGGAHVFAFFDEPVPVPDAEAVAKGMAHRLGLSNGELFPRLQSEGSNPFCISAPYFMAKNDLLISQVGIKPNGAEWTFGDFLRTAERLRMTAEQRAAIIAMARPEATNPGPVEFRRLKSKPRPKHFWTPPVGIEDWQVDVGRGLDIPEDERLKCHVALSVLDADCTEKIWFRYGCCIYEGFPDDAGFELFHRWSERGKRKYVSEADCRKKWNWIAKGKRRLEASGAATRDLGTIYADATQADPGWWDRYDALLRRRASEAVS